MTTVFTICSANYLAQAKTLGDSVREHNPEYHFVIGLVDRRPAGLARTYLDGFELILVEDIAIPAFADMLGRYDIVELNTAVKPFYIDYLYQHRPDTNEIIYLDPDILVLDSLAPLVRQLQQYSLVLTPHSCAIGHAPENVYYERVMLRTGLFNLGFLGTSRREDTLAFLKWWQRRLVEYCYARWREGLFVDQLWAMFALVYVRNVLVETNPGYNMSYWNLFERQLAHTDGGYVVNRSHRLVFYHFSSYKPTVPEAIATRPEQPVPVLLDRPDLAPLFVDYQRRLLANDYETIRQFACHFVPPAPAASTQERWRGRVKTTTQGAVRGLLRILPTPIRSRCVRLAEFVAYASTE